MRKAGVLLGAARSMRRRMGTKVNPSQRVFEETAEAEVRKTSGTEEAKRLMDQGAEMQIEDLLSQVNSA